jgi:hypothetical protein
MIAVSLRGMIENRIKWFLKDSFLDGKVVEN